MAILFSKCFPVSSPALLVAFLGGSDGVEPLALGLQFQLYKAVYFALCSVVLQACNPSMSEAEAEGLRSQGLVKTIQ